MSILQLADAKTHLRVTITDDDTLIQNQINAAEDWLVDFLGTNAAQLAGWAAQSPSLLEAERQLVSFLYDNRAAAVVGNTITVTQMTPGFYDLLAPYRCYVF